MHIYVLSVTCNTDTIYTYIHTYIHTYIQPHTQVSGVHASAALTFVHASVSVRALVLVTYLPAGHDPQELEPADAYSPVAHCSKSRACE